MKIGRYKILFNPHKLFWVQTHKPATFKQWGWFLLLKEVDLTKSDRTPQFKVGTQIDYGGRQYRYCKFGEE